MFAEHSRPDGRGARGSLALLKQIRSAIQPDAEDPPLCLGGEVPHVTDVTVPHWMTAALKVMRGATGPSRGARRAQLRCPDEVNFRHHSELVPANRSCISAVCTYCVVDNPSRIYSTAQWTAPGVTQVSTSCVCIFRLRTGVCYLTHVCRNHSWCVFKHCDCDVATKNAASPSAHCLDFCLCVI